MKCGNCKGEHETTQEVKECYSGHQSRFVYDDESQPQKVVGRTPPPDHTVKGPTQNQRNFIEQLLEQTGKTQDDLPKPVDNMTFKEVSDCISHLLEVRSSLGKRSAAPTKLPPNIRAEDMVPQGTYTVVFSKEYGDYITLRFREPRQGKWRGTQLVEFLFGPDNNHDYRRCGNWTGNGYRVWADFKRESRVMRGVEYMANATKEDTINAGEVFALESGNCWRCGRTLTREDSITRGMGAKCASIVLG